MKHKPKRVTAKRIPNYRELEQQARKLCRLDGRDPDEPQLTARGHGGPLWMVAANHLREHLMTIEALKPDAAANIRSRK